jgi:5'-nucleotidase
MSGTIGATYAAIERGIPAVAFSSGNTVPKPYYWVNARTAAGLQDPATITARLASSFVQSLIDKAAGSRLMPPGYGITVNLPNITSYTSSACTNPPFVLTRMAANAGTDKAAYNAKTGLFSYASAAVAGGSQCTHGNCSLPSELDLLTSGCMSSVTVFLVKYDASSAAECFNITDVTALVPIVVQLNGTVTTVPDGNVSHPPPASPSVPIITSTGEKIQWPLGALVLGFGVAGFLL